MRVLVCGTNSNSSLLRLIENLLQLKVELLYIDFDHFFIERVQLHHIRNSIKVVDIEDGYCSEQLEQIIDFEMREKKIDFAITTLELLVEKIAKICDKFGIKFTSLKAIQNAKDKGLIQNILRKLDLNSIRTQPYIRNSFPNMKFPLILKPRKGVGSFNVKKICSTQDFMNLDFQEIHYMTRNISETFILEEYKQGFLISVEAMSVKGDIRFLTTSLRERCAENEVLELGSIVPAPITFEIQEKLEQMAKTICEKIEFDRGICHIEFIVENNLPYLIDFNPRMPGVRIPEVYQTAYGTSMEYFAAHSYLDIEPASTPKPKCVARNRLLGLNREICESQYNKILKVVEESSGAVKLTRGYNELRRLSSNLDYFGEIVVTGNSYKIAYDSLEMIYSDLQNASDNALMTPDILDRKISSGDGLDVVDKPA